MPDTQSVHSVRKAIAILRLVADSRERRGIKDVIHSLNLPPASCYRLVRTLIEEEMLWQDDDGALHIGFGLSKLARGLSETEREIQSLQPALYRLSARLHLPVKISTREGDWAVTRLRAEPVASNMISNPVGTRVHLAQGSAATTLLSALKDEEVKEILARAPPEVWLRQSPEDVLGKVREFRRKSVARDFGVQHPSIYAVSMGATLTSGERIAVSVVGWPEDFEGKCASHIQCELGKTMEEMGLASQPAPKRNRRSGIL